MLRQDRKHLCEPEILTDKMGNERYAVVCGFYQLHRQEGVAAGLRSKLDNAKPSVNAETMLGDYRTPNFSLQPRMSVAEPPQVDVDAIIDWSLSSDDEHQGDDKDRTIGTLKEYSTTLNNLFHQAMYLV